MIIAARELFTRFDTGHFGYISSPAAAARTPLLSP
jgi:hypothetical protein